MGETQLYSQRLHGITEKRRILSEVDQIQRELEQQRVKLQQLKRKSLRDRWLMDGLVPTAGAEVENPLSETEGQIKELELKLESLQSELVYLENPELRALKGVKVQGVTLQKELVNCERNLKQVDQNENLKEHPITEEPDQAVDSQREKPAAVSQKDRPSNTEEVSAPHNNVSENHEAEHNLDLQLSNEPDDKKILPSQNVKDSIQIHGDGDHKSLGEEHEILNSGHNQDRKGEHQEQGGNPLNGDKAQNAPSQLGSLENTLEQEDQNSISVGETADDSGKEDSDNDLLKPNEDGKESLLDEITKLVNLGHQEEDGQPNQDGNKPSTEQPGPLTHNDGENSQNLGGNKVSVLVSHAQGHPTDEELVLSLETERGHPVLLDAQEEGEKPLVAHMEMETPGEDHAPDSEHALDSEHAPDSERVPDSKHAPNSEHAPDSKHAPNSEHAPDSKHAPNSDHVSDSEHAPSLVLPPSDRDVCTTLPCKDQAPIPSLLSGGQNQVQISQIVVVSPSGHEQSFSNSAQGPSAPQQPGAGGTGSSAPESQPLLQKRQETDAHQGANTAETRDKSTPTKKKTCQCCVVM